MLQDLYDLCTETIVSGIYGIYRYDGAPADPYWLERMKEAMAYYGPDGGGRKVDGPAGMGHLLLEVNPEDAFESQPVRGERGLVACAARLDNRDTLLETFKISASEAVQIADGHLVSYAFDRWGEDVCSHLEGDWALAAWNARERRLLLARDALGGAGLYYYEGKGFIAFASSLKALLALPGVRKEPDWLRLTEVLVSWQHDAELTAFKGFRCLLGAHAMTIGPSGKARSWRFWSQAGREPLKFHRDEEYVEAFLDHYTRAVRSCLRTKKPVAAELSGGRDSGSVVAMAAPILASQGRELVAYTSIPLFPPDGAEKRRSGNEWDLAHATATMAGANVKHIGIDARNHGVIQGIEHYLNVHDGPGHAGTNTYWAHAILEAASQGGAGALLSGQVGNETVSWLGNGSALLALAQGNLATALRLFFQAEKNPWMTMKRQIVKPALLLGIWGYQRLRPALTSPWRSYSALNVQMAKELDLDGRMHAAGHDPTFTRSPLRAPRYYYSRIMYGADICITSELGAWHSFAYVDPTANLSLFEFILRVPDDQFYRRSERNFLMKRAFRDRMPESVLYGERKGLQAADAGHRILRELDKFQECLRSLDALPEAREILDLPLMHRCLEDLVAKVDPHTTRQAGIILLRGLGVGLFLRHLLVDSRSCESQVPC
jgi:asparagine synthase (glutamine-hydrolysing)